jgi:hypothetical protein
MPTTDWQFWVVTAIALAALWRVGILVSGVVKPLFRKGRGATKRTSLTISAKGRDEPPA